MTPKFRVYNTCSKEFTFYGDPIIEIRDSCQGLLFQKITQTADMVRAYCELEQWTGLLDKNGTEIYEGDVLGGGIGLMVRYCEVCKQFQLFDVTGCYACLGEIQWRELVEDKTLEVVGNVHENPELLK